MIIIWLLQLMFIELLIYAMHCAEQCIYLFTISSLQGNTERLSNFPKWSRNCQLPSLQMRKLLLFIYVMLLAFHLLPVFFFKLWLLRNFRTRILIIHFLYYICSFNFKLFHFVLNPHFLQPYRLNSTFKGFWYYHPAEPQSFILNY